MLSTCMVICHIKSHSICHIYSILLILHKDLVRNTIISYFYYKLNKLKLEILYSFHQNSSEFATIKFPLGSRDDFLQEMIRNVHVPVPHVGCYSGGPVSFESFSCLWADDNPPPLTRKEPLLSGPSIPRDGGLVWNDATWLIFVVVSFVYRAIVPLHI